MERRFRTSSNVSDDKSSVQLEYADLRKVRGNVGNGNLSFRAPSNNGIRNNVTISTNREKESSCYSRRSRPFQLNGREEMSKITQNSDKTWNLFQDNLSFGTKVERNQT